MTTPAMLENIMEVDSRVRHWLYISLIKEVGVSILAYAYENSIDPVKLWNASKNELINNFHIHSETARKFVENKRRTNIGFELENLRRLSIEFCCITNDNYPKYLKNIKYPPPIIFYRGKHPSKFLTCVSIVGTRKCSVYGEKIAKELAQNLSELSITIVSGMALGIDTHAHSGALNNHGSTIAVLGCGVDIAYPSRNKQLYEKIAQQGCVISEYPPQTLALPYHFPARNRIISGLSKLVVVVEAEERSGALITADFALSQGRDVGVVPGSIFSKSSKGCHKLIKSGAFIVETYEDILEQLGIVIDKNKDLDSNSKLNENLSLDEKKILKTIPYHPVHIDEIIREVKLDPNLIISNLLMLELNGFLIKNSGNRYQRVK